MDKKKPDYYYKDPTGECSTVYSEENDAEATCWNCGKTFLCDPCDACCRLCDAPFAKERCEEFGFKPTPKASGVSEPKGDKA